MTPSPCPFCGAVHGAEHDLSYPHSSPTDPPRRPPVRVVVDGRDLGSTADYRHAPSRGDDHHGRTWDDKPHRLLYDLCGALEEALATRPTLTRAELVAAVLADPEAVREVVEALRSERVKVAGPWIGEARRNVLTRNRVGEACELRDGWSAAANDGRAWTQHPTRKEARAEVDRRLVADGWLLCGGGE